MAKLDIKPVTEIIEQAINELLQTVDMENITFSEFINKLEQVAHKIYLKEEKEAIKKIILDRFDINKPLKEIIEKLSDFIAYISTSIANTRRSRAGISSEYILGYALKYYAGISNEIIGHSKSRKKTYYPDIAIPSKRYLEIYPNKSVALAVKRTFRERWREDISIFKHYHYAALVCISESTDISKNMLKNMDSEGIDILFLPDNLYSKHRNFILQNLNRMKVYELSKLPEWVRNKLKN